MDVRLPPAGRALNADSSPHSCPTHRWGVAALNGAATEPASKTKPSWYLVATADKMIPPDAQRAMAKRAGASVTEQSGSHAIYVSQPKVVADVIEKAAQAPAM